MNDLVLVELVASFKLAVALPGASMCVDEAVHTQFGGGPSMEPPSPYLGAPLRELAEGRKPQAWMELISLPTPWSSWEMTHRSNEGVSECVCVCVLGVLGVFV